MGRVGLLGGTFDPPHYGHLWLGETAVSQLHLDEVWFLPVGNPPHKQNTPVTSAHHRLEMSRLATENVQHFLLNTVDMERPHPHTTASLLTLLREQSPNIQFWLLMGSDSLRDFGSWVMPGEVVKQCRLGVLPRPGVTIEWERLQTAVPNLKQRLDWLEGPTMDISSTTVRAWAQAGHSLRFLLPPAVESYIRQHALYRQ